MCETCTAPGAGGTRAIVFGVKGSGHCTRVQCSGAPAGIHLGGGHREHARAAGVGGQRQRPPPAAQLQHDAAQRSACGALRQLVDQDRRPQRLRVRLLRTPASETKLKVSDFENSKIILRNLFSVLHSVFMANIIIGC